MNETPWSDPAARRAWDFEPASGSEPVLRAFHRYHRWSGEDDVGLRFLLERAGEIREEGERSRRREELMERAVQDGHVSREVAERAYEVAREEGLEPAFALEVVAARVALARPAEQEAEAPARQTTPPDWIEDSPTPDEARRERVMRETFRRLRRLFEGHPDPRDAFRALGLSEDLRSFDY